MNATNSPPPVLILPCPVRVDWSHGECPIGKSSSLTIDVNDPRVEAEARRWLNTLSERAHAAPITIASSPAEIPEHEHRLRISPRGVELMGGSAAACFHGLQTLRQLTAQHRGIALPCGEIIDRPDLPVRGLLHDVTRGKCPTLATLKLLVDQLALLKVNQLQLYIEHAFVFSFDRDICDADHGLTPDEVRELDRYCRERFIDLVPSLATFGHMGRVLSLPQYRSLAEVEATRSWEAMPWPERMRGFTLNCTDSRAWRLVEQMWDDVLSAFGAPIVNICGDEPWDLGEGKNKGRWDRIEKGRAYLGHIRRTQEYCAARGRSSQFWSDVVTHYPERFDLIPRDCAMLHWGYDDRADYEGTRRFVDAGIATIACPGTSGWKRVLNGMNLAERNIAAFADAARRHGAVGLLNTDWGDHGHINPLAASWHGIALGACLAWRTDHVTGQEFDSAFSRTVLGLEDAAGVALLRKAARLADRFETWRLLWQPVESVQREANLPDSSQIIEAIHDAERCAAWWQGCADERRALDPQDAAELAVASRLTRLSAEKFALLTGVGSTDASSDHDRWANEIAAVEPAIERAWLARNKPGGLEDIRSALRAAASDMHAARPTAVVR